MEHLSAGERAVCGVKDAPTPQPLPEHLAPTPAECAAHLEEYQEYLPAARLPRAGETVVIDLGHVMWLVILDQSRPVTEDNSLIMSAGMLGTDRCQRVDWDSAGPVDPGDVNLEDEDAAALPGVRARLIERANTTGS